MKKLEKNEIDLIINSLEINIQHIASVIRDRKLLKNENEKGFNEYIKNLDNTDLQTIEELKKIERKII